MSIGTRPEPGVYRNVSWEEYLAIEYLNPSTLKSGLRSMKHLKRDIDGDIKRSDTEAKAMGNSIHCLVSGEFDQRCAVMPAFEMDAENLTAGKSKSPPKNMTKQNGDPSALALKWVQFCKDQGLPADHMEPIRYDREKPSEGKEKLTDYYQTKAAEFKEANQNKIVLTEVQRNTSLKVIKEINACRPVKRLLDASEKEIVVIARIGGLMTKTRIDMIDFENQIVSDLKTTNDVEPMAFWRTVKKLDYRFQFAFHIEALSNVPDGFEAREYKVIAAEVGGDYDVGLINVPLIVLDKWRGKVLDVIQNYQLAKAAGNYMGLYPLGKDELYVPESEMQCDEDELHNFDAEVLNANG